MTWDNTNKGCLFKNTIKKTAADPDYSGHLNIEGTKYNIIALRRIAGEHSKKMTQGDVYFSISFVAKETVEDDFETPNAPGSGVLFKNAKASEENNQPNYRGSVEHGGADYWLSAWLKESGAGTDSSGKKFLSMSLKLKDVPNSVMGSSAFKSAEAKIKAQRAGKSILDEFDDIPF